MTRVYHLFLHLRITSYFETRTDASWRWEDTRNAAGVWEVLSAHLLEVIPGAAGTAACAQGSQQADSKRLLTNMQSTACTAHASLLRHYYSFAKVIKHNRYCCNHLNTAFHIRPQFSFGKQIPHYIQTNVI